MAESRKFILHAPFEPAGEQPEAIAKLTDGVEKGLKKQVLLGVTGCGKTFALANVIANTGRPTLLIAHNKTLAAQLYGEMRGFFPENAVEYFVSYYDYYQPEAYVPSSDTYIEKDSAINAHIDQMRISATKSLIERRDIVIVATVSAIYGIGAPESYLSMVLKLECGMILEQRKLLGKFTELQYSRNDFDFTRGTYRVRGETVDIFPADSDQEAVRLEIFDDRLNRITCFDPLTGALKQDVKSISIYPKTHYVTPRQNVLDAVETIKTELAPRLLVLHDVGKLVEEQRLRERTNYDIEMLLELGYCTGIENYSRHLSKRAPGEPPPTLMDYLPKDALLVIDESHVTVPQIGGMYLGDRSRKQTLVDYGFRLPSALDNRPLRFEEFEQISPPTIYVSATPGPYEMQRADLIVELVVRPTGLLDPEVLIRPANSQVDDLLSEINKRVALHERVLVTTLTKRMAEDLSEYLAEQGVKVRYLHSDIDTVERVQILRDLRLGTFDVLVGINLLREGLDLPEVSLVAILDADKEGFLRSTQALIQTSGRAARNINGQVIMYADKITNSMRRALDEMDRRREIQRQFNEAHGITPQGIIKSVADVMSSAFGSTHSSNQPQGKRTTKRGFNLEKSINQKPQSPEKLAKQLQMLEKKMQKHARNLEFEEAAAIRDQISELKNMLFYES